jgi:hypothetical protein
MSKNSNPTSKQHFVPQFYLKRFADEKKFLQVLDLKNWRIGSPRPYPSVGYEHYFYAAETGIPDEVSQHIEGWLQVYESIISNELPNIITKILNYEHIDDDDRYILSALMCMLWLRSPQMRDHLHKMDEDMTKKIMSMYVPQRVDAYIKENNKEMSEEQRKKLIENFENKTYNLKFNNAQHLKFMTENFGFGSPGFTNLFFGHKWKIYIARGKQRFVTTDSPVVEWWLPPETFYGRTFLERNKYFALTPEIFIELTYSRETVKVKRETIFENKDNKVDIYNMLLAAHSQSYVYSANKSILERLLFGRKNPGELEKAYYLEYEHPWEINKKKYGEN